MRIGIVTFWQTRDNYGQMLQCFALQQALKMLGHDPFLIRYLHSEHRIPWQDQLKHVLRMFLLIKWNRLFLKQKHLPPMTEKDRQRDFDSFKEAYLEKSDLIYSSLSDLKKNSPKADCYIVGSDQVWSKRLSCKENQVFFLDFGGKSTMRISYAASFSMEKYPVRYKKALKKQLSRFDGISVREKTGVHICEDIGHKAQIVADPTLLLNGKDYKSAFDIRTVRRNQVFIYSLNISSAEEIRWSEIRSYANETGLDVKVTPSSGYIPSSELFGGEVCYDYCKIQDWLEHIATSELVITTSFHGVVFCLLFHTPFIYVPLSGKFSRGNNRVLDLLDYLEIQGHVLKEGKSIKILANEPFQWSDIDEKINFFREESITFLTRFLCHGKRE